VGQFAAASCIVAASALIVAAWLLLRHGRRERGRAIQEGPDERARAERELPDALLQNFQGVLLKVHAAAGLVIEHPAEARSRLDDALAQADQTIAEARDALQGLNPPTDDLTEDLLQLGTELGADPGDESAPVLRVEVRGRKRPLSLQADAEARRIAREAIRSAFDAAGIDGIQLDIHYGVRAFELKVHARADVPALALPPASLPGVGHWSPSLKEQLRLAGGRLSINRRSGAGFDLALSIPARVAYL
jgi:signal transduction histidine kinase